MRLLAATLLLLTGSALAAPATFGTRTLEIPEPVGFKAASQAAPQFVQIAQGYLPPDNRLIEVYVTPADRDAFSEGREVDLSRYFQLQVGRPVDGKAFTPSAFESARDSMESEMVKALGSVDTQAQDLAKKGNDQLKEVTGSDAQLSFGKIRYLGTFRREPWGLFFSLGSDVSVTGSDAPTADTGSVLSSGALVLVNHQILYLYAYAVENQPGARQWAEGAVSAWADAVRAANPDDPAVAKIAEDLQGPTIFRSIGWLAGALIGVIVALALVRRKNA